jgi:hypothetical protein
MRGAARFASLRNGVTAARRLIQARRLDRYITDCEVRMSTSVFGNVNRVGVVDELNKNGVALGLRIEESLVHAIRSYALRQPCYADRSPSLGFELDRRVDAESQLGKPILVAQYFNTEVDCPAVASLKRDPLLLAIAAEYLQSIPTFVGANLWWTFAVDALAEDRDRHAHLYHRDVDDFRFLKFFFYLTDVDQGEGAHICVASSHRRVPRIRFWDRWNIRRYSDFEIECTYPKDKILEICGPAGTGFAENTLCIHKGRTPISENRLILQLQYALFDYGVMHDRRDAALLSLVA